MILLLIIALIILSIIALFSFPQFSPIPYFPTNRKDLKFILTALDLKSSSVTIDLGAGDGLVIFEAARIAYKKNFRTQFIAVEINPILILIMNIRKLFHPNKKNIRIVNANMFYLTYKKIISKKDKYITIFIYISPWFIEKTLNNIKNQLSNFNVVSYMYPVKIEKLRNAEKKITGNIHDVYIYKNINLK